MKRKIDVFWYWFLIIVSFVICFMFLSSKISRAYVVDPDNGITDNTGTTNEQELYESCYTYITTNIISAESLTEALNGKIYGNFTQEDCMEMINIASKREVIKNLFNFNSLPSVFGDDNTAFVDYETQTITINNRYGNYTGIELKKLAPSLEIGKEYIINANTTSSQKYIYLNGSNITWYYNTSIIITDNHLNSIVSFYGESDSIGGVVEINNIQIEKGSTVTPYVSYDYHREYYEDGYSEGVTYADNRINTESASFNNGYNEGIREGYNQAVNDGKGLGTLIPNLLGGLGSFFLTILNIDFLGFNLLSILGILITILGIIVVIKIISG